MAAKPEAKRGLSRWTTAWRPEMEAECGLSCRKAELSARRQHRWRAKTELLAWRRRHRRAEAESWGGVSGEKTTLPESSGGAAAIKATSPESRDGASDEKATLPESRDRAVGNKVPELRWSCRFWYISVLAIDCWAHACSFRTELRGEASWASSYLCSSSQSRRRVACEFYLNGVGWLYKCWSFLFIIICWYFKSETWSLCFLFGWTGCELAEHQGAAGPGQHLQLKNDFAPEEEGEPEDLGQA
jgi:hypothetical protein